MEDPVQGTSLEMTSGEESIRDILEEMHKKMQILCAEISKGKMSEAEAPARAVLQSCSTLRTLSSDTTPLSSGLHTNPSAMISEGASVFAETDIGGSGHRSRGRAHSAHPPFEAESFSSRLLRLEQQRAVDLQQLREELKKQILEDLKPELQAIQLEHGAELKRQELHLRGPKMHRFPSWEAVACEERLEVTRLALAQMQSEVTAQAELLEHVQQQVIEFMAPPAMERCSSKRPWRLSEQGAQGSTTSTPQAVPVGQLRNVVPLGGLQWRPDFVSPDPEVTGEDLSAPQTGTTTPQVENESGAAVAIPNEGV